MVNFGQSFKLKITSLPQSPGVYQFLDKTGGVIYIGKAKNLRARVRQYFAGDDSRPQIPYLMKEAANLDYTMVNTELESLYLERTLIQKHHPKYNIELKDDKNYAFIKIDYSTEIPQVVIKRRVNEDKGYKLHPVKSRKAGSRQVGIFNRVNTKLPTYFGPFTSAKKIRDLIFTARRTFGLCANEKISSKPCFYFHLHRCPGVCVGKISLEDYAEHLEKIKLFFSGKITPAVKTISAEMNQAAKKKKFEAAARLRDQLRALKMLEERQNVIMAKPVDWDIIGQAVDEGVWCINLFKIRQGRMLDKENFIYENKTFESTNDYKIEALKTFLEQYYLETSDVPKEIFVPMEINNQGLIKGLVKDRFKKSVVISIPKKGKAAKLIGLSQTNAREYLKNYLNEKAGHLDKIQRGLAQLKEILELDSTPKRIEGFDISNIQGTNPVGSMVVFESGLPKKSEYRKFKIQTKSASGGPDDFAMMAEMLQRRLQHFMKHETGSIKQKAWPIPDLIVIDGGKGQLSAAMEVFLGSRFKVQVIGLAKRIEEIFVPGKKQPIILSHDNPALQLLQRLRDEAHRFGITFHRQLRSKQAIKSALDEIPGIGPKTKKLLKAKFGTVANIKNANFDELKEAIGEKLAREIKNRI